MYCVYILFLVLLNAYQWLVCYLWLESGSKYNQQLAFGKVGLKYVDDLIGIAVVVVDNDVIAANC